MRNRTKEHTLCQKIPLVEDKVNVKDPNDPNDEAEEFEMNKDDWYFGWTECARQDSANPKRNLQLGLLAKEVSCNKNFEQVIRRTYTLKDARTS